MVHTCHHHSNHHPRCHTSIMCQGLLRHSPYRAQGSSVRGPCITVPPLPMRYLRPREVEGFDDQSHKPERQRANEEPMPAGQATFPASKTSPLGTGLNELLNLKSRFSCPVEFLIYQRPVESILQSHKHDKVGQPSVLMGSLQPGMGCAPGPSPVFIEP